MPDRGTESEQQRYIDYAADGDRGWAWACVFMLVDILKDMRELDQNYASELDLAVEFFDVLWGIHKEARPRVASIHDLSNALNVLHVRPPRGRKGARETRLEADSLTGWEAVRRIQSVLEASTYCPVMTRYAARFFEELLSIRSAHPQGEPTGIQLAGSFRALNLLVDRGERTKVSDAEIMAWLACVEIEYRRTHSYETARQVVATRRESPTKSALRLRDWATQRRDLIAAIALLTDEELQQLADSLSDSEGRDTLRD